MQITENTTVLMDYTLTDDEGNIIDSTQGGQPLSYIHGIGNIIPGLEKALEGKSKGEKIQVAVPPSEAYGEHSEEFLQTVPRQEFKGIDKIEVGMQFQSQSPQGHYQIVTVTKVEGDDITIDTNHPLAGMNLNFDVTIVDVKETSTDESHGCSHEKSHCGEHEHSANEHQCGCEEGGSCQS